MFQDGNAHKVLHVYADLLIESFSSQELQEGVFTAVGQVHRPKDDKGDKNQPRHLGHYWPDYDSELSGSEPKPKTFVQYVFAGLAKLHTTGETYQLVEKIAEGILRLASMANGATARPWGRHKHRNLLKLLEPHPDIQKRYTHLVMLFVLNSENLTKEAWNAHIRTEVRTTAAQIAGASLDDPEAIAFLEWRDEQAARVNVATTQKSRDNIYRFSKNGKNVEIRVGSIHSAKERPTRQHWCWKHFGMLTI